MKQYDQLISQVQKLEQQLEEAKREKRLIDHQIKNEKKISSKVQTQIKTLQTLNLGIFSMLDAAQIYSLSCESAVYQLGWDSAFVITLRANRPVILTSFQATTKQVNHIRDYLSENQVFNEAYAQKTTLSTYNQSDTRALSLRSLFQTDEVVATPIIFGQHLYAFLVVCSHTQRSKEYGVQDLDFLASVAAQIGHAIQNSYSFRNLESQNLKLRQLDEVKNSFISITSHQLRTPLSIIKWILSILETDDQLKPLDKQMRLIEQAYESNERLIHVVNDLLNVSRIQEGRLPLNVQLTDMRVILHDLQHSAERISASKHLRLDWKISEAIPLLELDPLLFKEALQNLVDKAIDYNLEAGIIHLDASVNDKEVVIAITNSGLGISDEDQHKIFNQFYRSPEAVRTQPNGNGLGLYLSRAIIKEHGGDIDCQSTLGKETTFTVHLPLPKIKA